ncbi:MAG TPA: hypothetical protein VII64_03960 [Thermodesulfobacteriota bacterium]
MKKNVSPAVKTISALLIPAIAALFPAAGEAAGAAAPDDVPDAVKAPAFDSRPAAEKTQGFADGAPGDKGAAPAFQPSGRMTRLFSSIMEVGSFPMTLCGLIENSASGGSYERLATGTGAGFSEILSDESRVVGTGLGYEIGPGLRVQGFGIFDMDENSAYAGPALTYNFHDSIGLTTGVQVPLNEPVSERQDFFFAEIRLLF